MGRYLELEVALARAQARSGVVPQPAADEIDAAACSIKVDFGKLRQETESLAALSCRSFASSWQRSRSSPAICTNYAKSSR